MPNLTVAASEGTFRTAFNLLRDNFVFQEADSTSFGAFRAGYDVRAHLEGGSVDLRGDNTVRIDELDLKWDKLEFSLGVDIPEICVGGGCINLPWPLPDLCLPRFCVFDNDPDVSVAIDLASFVAQEISLVGSVVPRFFDASAPLPSPDLCALLRIEPLPTSDRWHIHIDPQQIDLDLFDFPDIIGDLFEDLLTAAISAIIPGGWVRDLLLAIIGGIADLIRWILDIPDEIDEWLSDLFNVSFGLGDLILTLIADFLAACNPVFGFDQPFEVLPAAGGLIPVAVPIQNLNVRVDDDEMVVQADIGA